MAQQDKHFTVSDAVDLHLGSADFREASRTPAGKYEAWYASLLTSIALVADDETVVFAHSDAGAESSGFRVTVFTATRVFIADVDVSANGVPTVRVVGRRSLIALSLSASERIDANDRRSWEWPGKLTLVLTYRDLPDPIEIVANGANTHSVSAPAAIVTFIESLKGDLADVPTGS